MYRKSLYKGIIGELRNSNTFYKKLISQKKKQLAYSPSEKLRVITVDSKPYYYIRTSAKDTNGKLISKTPANQKLVRRIAQRDYDTRVLKIAEKQHRILENFLKKYNPDSVDDLYNNLSDNQKKLVVPVFKSNEEFVNEWLKTEYEKSSFNDAKSPFLTMRGEYVRSKSELLIANTLFSKKIPYHYEKPLTFKDGRTIRPDFTILDIVTGKEIYWEHFGIIDDDQYRQNMLKKIDAFERDGYIKSGRTIFTYEMATRPLTTQTIDDIIASRFGK